MRGGARVYDPSTKPGWLPPGIDWVAGLPRIKTELLRVFIKSAPLELHEKPGLSRRLSGPPPPDACMSFKGLEFVSLLTIPSLA